MKHLLLRGVYELVRKNPTLNFLAHKIMQSEAVHRFPPYWWLYWKFIRSKAARIMEVPPYLELTVTDACNARCVMCPPEVHRGKTIMNQELFQQVVREAREVGIEKMILTGGEALLDKQIGTKIRFAKEQGFTYVHLFTNGALMSEERAREIITSGLDSLTWSIDSARKEEYEKIRVGLDFDRVVTNFRSFVEIRDRLAKKTPLTRVNMVALPENRESRAAFRQFFSELADIVEIIDSHNFAGSQVGLQTDCGHEYSQQERYPCHLLFTKLVIWPDGSVRKCSIDYAPHARLGTLGENSLKEILTSRRLLDLKRAHLNGCFDEPGCNVCTFKESWWVKPL